MENDFTKNLKNILKNKRIRKFPGKIAMATSLAVILSANAFAGGITAEAAEFDYQEEDLLRILLIRRVILPLVLWARKVLPQMCSPAIVPSMAKTKLKVFQTTGRAKCFWMII